MRRFQLRHSFWVALLLCLSLLVGGCTTAPPSPGEAEPSSSNHTLTLWHALSEDEAEVLQGLADEWASRQEGEVQVQLEASSDEDSLHQKLTASIQTEMMPSLAFVRPSDIAAYVDADALVALDSLMEEGENPLTDEEREDFYTSFWESVRYARAGNAQYAWPVHRHQTLLFINRTRMQELNQRLPPATWEALVAACAAHRARGGPNCFAAHPTGSVAVLWIWSHDGRMTNEAGTQPTFQNEAGQEVMHWLGELRALDGVYQAPTYEGQRDAFVDGTTLFTFDSTAAIPEYEALINSEWDLAVMPPPSTDEVPVTVATGGNAAIFRSDPETQALAWDFLRFWTDTQANYQWADALGAYPVRQSALEQLEAQWPEDSLLRQAAEWLPYARSEPMLAAWPQVSQALAQAIINTINGQAMPDEALEEAARRAEGLLNP
ncbi:MAG TPA: extracellular solute-binding protein [Ardenticatenaceae bacterium]|jgi:multiple sugar transport system substrate-binding protein